MRVIKESPASLVFWHNLFWGLETLEIIGNENKLKKTSYFNRLQTYFLHFLAPVLLLLYLRRSLIILWVLMFLIQVHRFQ